MYNVYNMYAVLYNMYNTYDVLLYYKVTFNEKWI